MSEIDIVPELLEEIANDFKEQFKNNSKIINIWGKIKSKMVSYQDANEFAIECGEMLAKSYSKFISVDTLPEGRMWFNIASRILEPTLRTNYSLITDVCNEAQTLMNEEMGLGLKAITPPINQNRIDGLINKVSNAEKYEDVEWVLQEPIVNISQSMVDEYMKTNAEFHYQSGLTPKIVRKAESGACKWCLGLVGEYEYPAVPSDVYRRHENCRCTVEYIRDGKYRQNVYSKEWANGNMPPEERERQAYQRYQARERQWAREEEKRGVAKLMREHPDWSESGATIYYRTNISPSVTKVTPAVRNYFAHEDDLVAPKKYAGVFDGFDKLTLTSKEKQVLTALHNASNALDYEYIAYINGDEISFGTSNNHAVVAVDQSKIKKGTKLYHSHTSDSPPSLTDMYQLLNENVEEIGVVCYNQDAYTMSIGDSYRPTKTELDDFANSIYEDVVKSVMNMDGVRDMTPEEMRYLFFKERNYRIAREFEWSVKGGKLNE